MTRPLTEAQQAYARGGTSNMRKVSTRQAQQLAGQRRFVYDGWLAPTCRACGAARENRKADKCDRCLEDDR